MIVTIEGLRFSGKSTLVCSLSNALFQLGYSVSIIPEWRFHDNGPTELDEWVEKVISERKHGQMLAGSNNADIVITDRSFIGIEAFIRSTCPEKLYYFFSKVGDYSISDINIYLYANSDVLLQRAQQRQKVGFLLNDHEIQEEYFKIYNRLNISPYKFDTSFVSNSELNNSILPLILNVLVK